MTKEKAVWGMLVCIVPHFAYPLPPFPLLYRLYAIDTGGTHSHVRALCLVFYCLFWGGGPP